ncbi:MAG: hypothetical protein U5K76_04640 [Woeseiaceae bacterium]|nr:hypothetical protein [Woeseiaceae bacterium]
MTTFRRIMRVDFNGSTVSRDEMREFVETVKKRQAMNDKNTADITEFFVFMSINQCNEYLQDDDQAEAMRRGSALALHLANFDFPEV